LLSFILKKNRAYLYTYPEKILSPSELKNFQDLIIQRTKGLPIAYLINSKEFWSLELAINSHTLIPRPETEVLIQTVLKYLDKPNLRIADFGTGSGAIAIALSKEHPDWKIFALDYSQEALEITQKNIQKHQCQNIKIIHSDWGQNCPNELDAIVSNPPYLSLTDPHLSSGDLRFEPRSALISGKFGLEDFEKIILDSQKLLKPEGLLFFEHGYEQAQAVADLLKNNHFSFIETLRDLNNLDRVSIGKNLWTWP